MGKYSTEIPCQKQMKYGYRIYDRPLLIEVVSWFRVFVYLKHDQPRALRENVRRRPRIDRYNDKKARALDALPISS